MSNSRFFNYSDDAPEEYKSNLEVILNRMDRAHSVHAYTPFISVFCVAIVAALQTGVPSISPTDPSYFSVVQLILTATTALTLGIAGNIKDKYQTYAANLISLGCNQHFFKFTHPDMDQEMGTPYQRNMQLEIDAVKLRLLHKPS